MVVTITSHQMTPLHMAVYRNNLGTVRSLVDQGADTNIKDGNGVSKTVILSALKLLMMLTVGSFVGRSEEDRHYCTYRHQNQYSWSD